jgi:hypothetical protein
MDAPISPLKAPESRLPEYSIDVRRASSFFVYHDDRRNSAPGKNGLYSNQNTGREEVNTSLTPPLLRERILE